MAQKNDQPDLLGVPNDLGEPLDLQASIDEAIAQAERQAREAGAPPVDDDTPIPDLTPPPPGSQPEVVVPTVEASAVEPPPCEVETQVASEASDTFQKAGAVTEPIVEAPAQEIMAGPASDAAVEAVENKEEGDKVDAAVAAANDLAAQIDRLLDAGRKTAAGEAQAVAPEPVPAPTPEPPDPVQLDQLDQLLAEQADVAIADELAEPPVPPPPPAPEPVRAQDQQEVVASEPAEAQDVAAATDTEPSEPTPRRRKPSLRELLSLQTVHRVCVVLNRPIANASAQTRTLIGLIGLVTLGNACALMLYAFLFVIGS